MDFLDDDENKKKKKKAKSKKPKKPPLQRKEYYEEILAKVNERLAKLMEQIKEKEKRNEVLVKELVGIEDDRADVCEYLNRRIMQRQNALTIVQENLIIKQKEFQEYKQMTEQKLAEMQKRFHADRLELEKEIELQSSTIDALDRDRDARKAYLIQINEKNDSIDRLNEQTDNELFEMERKAVVQKKMLKEELDKRIDSLVKDVVHSNEIRKASYIRNLMKENVSLRDHMEKLINQTIRTMQKNERQMNQSNDTIESYVALEQLTKHIKRVIDNKENVIRNLLFRIDRIRLLYLETRRYFRFHQIAQKRGLLKAKRKKSFEEINKYLNSLANEKKAIVDNQRAQEQELDYMLSMLERLKSKIECTVLALENLGPNEFLDPVERRSTVEEMIFMTVFMSPRFPQCKSKPRPIYQRGSCGILKVEFEVEEKPIKTQLDLIDEDSSHLLFKRPKFDYETKLTRKPLTPAEHDELNKLYDEIVFEQDRPSDFVTTFYRPENCLDNNCAIPTSQATETE